MKKTGIQTRIQMYEKTRIHLYEKNRHTNTHTKKTGIQMYEKKHIQTRIQMYEKKQTYIHTFFDTYIWVTGIV